jgi:curved DNA-binding protein
MDYYSLLGVNKSASDTDIKKAFKAASMKHHPDRGGDAEKFKQINEAYQTLKDPRKRAEYDNPQPSFNSQTFNDPHFSDIFSSMFGQHAARRRANPDITVAVNLTLEEIMSGKNVIIQYRLASGKQETVEVQVPQGAKNGDQIRYENLGDDAVPHYPRGFLNVRIRELRDKTFVRDGDNIVTQVNVDALSLMLGHIVVITTPDKRSVKVNIPKGTQPGTVFNVSGYGIPNLNTRQKGHLYVKINCTIPKELDPELTRKIQELKDEINNRT